MGSTVRRNVKNITCKYDVPTKMCHGTYSSVKKFITTSHNNNVSIDSRTYASIIAECNYIMNCDTMNHNDANDIIIYLANI